MKQTENARLAAHMAQERMAEMLQRAALLVAVFATVRHGIAGGVASGLLFWLVRLARPGPCPTLDKITRRRDE